MRINKIHRYSIGRIIDIIDLWVRKYPYRLSFTLAVILSFFVLFFNISMSFTDDTMMESDEIEFLEMDMVSAPKRVTKKEVSTEEGEISREPADPERASGESESDAVDISFLPNATPPRMVSRLVKRYPKIAREMDIEAVVNIGLLISEEGAVKKVDIIGVRLLKELPPDIKARVMHEFMRDTKIMLMEARFTPPIVNGKRMSIKMDMPIRFELE